MESEWTIGITDSTPESWKKNSFEPIWEDETLTGVESSQHTYQNLMAKLCETAIKKRREYSNDYGVDKHLWKLKIMSMKEAMKPPNQFIDELFESSDESDDNDDENEESYRGSLIILCPHEEELSRNGTRFEDDDEHNCQLIKSNSKVNKELLPIGSIIECTYDYGSTTTLYLKVLNIKATVSKNLMNYFSGSINEEADLKDLQSIPAYKLPKEDQIDFHFPYFSKVFMGRYVPLFKTKQKSCEEEAASDNGGDNSNHDESSCDNFNFNDQNLISRSSLGLSARVTRDDDTTFCSIENRSSSSDLTFCPEKIELNEFLQVAEKAWTPRDSKDDPDKLHQLRHDMVCRFLVSSDNDDAYKRLVEQSISEFAIFGPKMLIYRLPKATEDDVDAIIMGDSKDDRNNNNESVTFDFNKIFPKTYSMLNKDNKNFRWFQYNNNLLRVLVGRGVGEDHRSFVSGQILRTWKRKFESFHELLCAVEASWVWVDGKELKSATVLPKFDTNLGPSNPGPKEPNCYSEEKDCVTILQSNEKNKLVTAMAITEEQHGVDGKKRMILYSGHDDGSLVKWALDDNIQLWSKQIYKDEIEQTDRSFRHTGVSIDETMGVAGIATRPHPSKKDEQLVYTWTNNIELALDDSDDGEEDSDEDNSTKTEFKPAAIKSWSANDGTLECTYNCDVGHSEANIPASPSIATVVFCKLFMDNSRWVDSIVVGLHCVEGASINYEDDYFSDFDLDKAQEVGEGTILPFYENSIDMKMETWRGNNGLIKAMAVIPLKYLFTLNVCEGHGLPESMVLWSLKQPGVPLHRHSFMDFSRSLFKQSLTRIDGVCGISISGTDILLADSYGDRIVILTVEENDTRSWLKLHGYGSIGNKHYEGEGYHGRMSMFGSYAVMANEINNTVWVFKVEGNSNHPELDRRDGNQREFDRGDSDIEDDQKYKGRSVAVGKFSFPGFGGNPPKRKKRKFSFGYEVGFPRDDEESKDEDHEDLLGAGGPVSLAIRGRYVVAGFTNGSIVRSSLLPKHFDSSHEAKYSERASSNNLTSCSSLSTCEWRVPQLIVHEAEDEEDNGYCSIS